MQRREPSLVMTSRGEMGRDRRATQQEEDTHTHTHMHVHTHTHTHIIMTDMCSYMAETSITL